MWTTPGLKRGYITLTDSVLAIAFSRETVEVELRGRIGIDVNERNVTRSDSSGVVVKEDTSAVAEPKEMYKGIRAKIAHRTSKDRRIRRGLLSKYGKREKDRTAQAIHRVTKRIVEHAKANGQSIVMERLKGIRKLYRKGNGQGTSFRGRMNSWAFHEVQRQVDYKARGRYTCDLRQPQRHVPKMPELWLPAHSTRRTPTPVSFMQHYRG